MAKENKPFGGKRGIRLPSNLTVIREHNGQFKVTIPKAFVELMQLEDGDVIRWNGTANQLGFTKERMTYEEFVQNLEERKRLKERVAR